MKKERSDERKNTSALNQGGKLVPVTVRFTADAMDVISEIAEANRMSKAELVRMVVDDRLIKYLENMVFIDAAQGEEIRKQLFELGTILGEIKLELHRIGVNVNQQTKIKNMQNKYGVATEKISISNDMDPSREIQSIMRRFEITADKVGGALCHILG